MRSSENSLMKCIYPEKLELKLKHKGTHATFLDLDVKTEDGIIAYKLFDTRDRLPFFIVHMPYFESNILSTIFYGSIFFRSYSYRHLLPRASELYSRMLSQGANQSCINK